MTQDYLQRFAGVGRLYGRDGLARLAAAHVAVIGLGGVGSWAAEALARSGVGALTLVDMDDVCLSNTNRQLHALDGTAGQPKAAVLKARAQAINPACQVEAVQRFFTPSSAGEILATARPLSAVVDAIDSLANKCLLLAQCRTLKLPVVSSGGCAGKRDATAVRVTDMEESRSDRLLKFVRKCLRTEYGFPREGKKFGIPCVWSPELSAGDPDGCASSLPGALTDGDELHPNCEWGYGTAVFVSGVFGFAAAGIVVNKIAAGEWG
ncbi:MAG: tRNA threonylcarbamoyladenosine dehydratase [Puniceicoccales bacterium]|nr:tRNA threonylcarbamoyladenosine dehydratase [Puniceicoccales bacterium]